MDMIQIGLIDFSWPARFLLELGNRLQERLDHPEVGSFSAIDDNVGYKLRGKTTT
jgi:hypothetical protein